MSYEDRLIQFKLQSLEKRRQRADIIELYRIINGIDRLDCADHILFADGYTRGHEFKIKKRKNKSDIGKYSYFSRIVGAWNSLPEELIKANSLGKFKQKHKEAVEVTIFL